MLWVNLLRDRRGNPPLPNVVFSRISATDTPFRAERCCAATILNASHLAFFQTHEHTRATPNASQVRGFVNDAVDLKGGHRPISEVQTVTLGIAEYVLETVLTTHFTYRFKHYPSTHRHRGARHLTKTTTLLLRPSERRGTPLHRYAANPLHPRCH